MRHLGAMKSTLDAWHTALLMIEGFDDGAAYEISSRAIDLIGRGDNEGAMEWWRVLAALVDLRSVEHQDPMAIN